MLHTYARQNGWIEKCAKFFSQDIISLFCWLGGNPGARPETRTLDHIYRPQANQPGLVFLHMDKRIRFLLAQILLPSVPSSLG